MEGIEPLSFTLTNDNRLGFTLNSNSCTCAGSHFHVVHHSHLQPSHHHRANGCIHRLIHMETCLIPQAPDLKQQQRGGKKIEIQLNLFGCVRVQ